MTTLYVYNFFSGSANKGSGKRSASIEISAKITPFVAKKAVLWQKSL